MSDHAPRDATKEGEDWNGVDNDSAPHTGAEKSYFENGISN